jgi:hypothetical protein
MFILTSCELGALALDLSLFVRIFGLLMQDNSSLALSSKGEG